MLNAIGQSFSVGRRQGKREYEDNIKRKYDMPSSLNDTLKISSDESLTNGQRQGLPPVVQRHFFHSPLVTFYDDDILYFLSRLSYYSWGVLIKATF
jgi:hypothetical protein